MKFLNNGIFVLFSVILFGYAESARKPTTHRRSYNHKTKQSIGSRIVKGKEVKENALPHQAALLFTDTSSGDSFVCGGSIIDAKWILTAAHCVEGCDHVSVRVGSIKFSSGGSVVNSTTFITHELYNTKDTLVNDIALIDLTANPITLNKNSIKVIKPVTRSGACAAFKAVTVSGFGKTSDTSTTSESLMQTTLNEVSTYDCVKVYGIDSVPSTVICAKGKDGEDSCQGDSGGPLLSGKTLSGIVSYGSDSCEAGVVGVYTKVSAYLDWIRNKTGISFDK